jgi:hypothetical protein
MVLKIVCEPTLLKQVISSAGVVAEQIGFWFTPTGVKIRGLSEHKIQMIVADIPASAFIEYQCDNEVTYSVKIDEISAIIKRTKKTTKHVTISLSDSSMIVFQFDDKEFTNRLVDPKDGRDMPNIPFTAFAEIEYETLREILDDASLGDKKDANYDDTTLHITMNEPKITFFRNTGTSTFKAEREHDGKNYNISGFGEIIITLHFLTQVIDQLKGTGIEKIKLSFGERVPLMAQVGEYTRYFIAPRVKE